MAVIYLVSDFVGNICKIYSRCPWFDIPMHILGGVATACTGLVLYTIARTYNPKWSITPRWLFYICTIGFVALVGVLWEHYEFLHDSFFKSNMQPSNTDTMKDFFNDLVGGILFLLVLTFRAKKHSKPGEY